MYVVCCCLSHSAYWLPPRKTTSHGGRSRSRTAEQGKRTKQKKSGSAPPPPPYAARSEKNKLIKITRRIYRRYAGLGPSCVRTRIPSTRRLGPGYCFEKFYASVCDDKFPSLVASLFSWRCLAASTSSFLHAAMNLRPPSVISPSYPILSALHPQNFQTRFASAAARRSSG